MESRTRELRRIVLKIFISWSGPKAQLMAEALRSWLRNVIYTFDPFLSNQDIAKGERGLPIIAQELQSCTAGIICVTRENNLAPWLNFEAGALSKMVGHARVIPLLLDLSFADLTGPLTQFQVVASDQKEEVFEMVRSLRDHGQISMDDQLLRNFFDNAWTSFEKQFQNARDLDDEAAGPLRDSNEVLEEVLILVRRQDAKLHELTDRISSIGNSVVNISLDAAEPPAPSDRGGRIVREELIPHLGIPLKLAQSYRFQAGKGGEELAINLEKLAITPDNLQEISSRLAQFVQDRSLDIALSTEDGVFISASPGRRPMTIVPKGPAWQNRED